jgi:UDP-N-acetylglucosamine 1-carboxyvinyltransferase
MDRIRIIGGRQLSGEIPIGGAKNAALPLMAAGLLTEERLLLTRVPRLADIETMAALLSQHGIATEWDETARTISLGGPITNTEAPYDIVRKMRASFLVLGPLLARLGEARVSLPGGCGIGTRPVDIHLKGLEQLGAEIELDAGYVVARVNGRLRGATIIFPTVSVGATENVVMAASLAEGQTILRNSAREPEIIDLCHCLVAMGAQITGIGTGELVIEGVERLHAATHAIIPDRIETGTYACAVAMTGGDVLLRDARLDHLGAVARIMEETGVSIEQTERGVRIRRLNGLHGADVMTEPYPGFPTDMQAQFMAMVAVADGASMITESIFENRFMHVSELTRMGARVNVHGSSAIVRGVPSLAGAQVMATDLRASSSLILAGLAAKGETVVSRVYHLDRGYEDVEGKLSAVGAQIERLTD